MVFDFEGTLAETSYFYYKLLRDSAKSLGINFRYSFSDIQVLRNNHISEDDLISCITPANLKEDYIKKLRDNYDECHDEYTFLFPETIDIALKLKNLDCRISIYTNMKQSWEELISSFPKLREVEEGVIFMNRTKAESSKPCPRALKELCNQMEVEPRRCVMVGDSSADMKMGESVGMVNIGVLTGVASEKELIESGANGVIPRIACLPEVLEEKNVRSS
ncbi:hypothetical protein AKJ41_06185 [candidate division MSBL1 archaeon SCGC-AAA259O05]|uniref:HAD family hydrolase n=1 Tax=candidate division MSBL1 archaeon SCGC-AAA259O05 TaxID=1698271 RepID=A0A133UXS1_9EURY|nr:hypothetical protein AKJ41_06185 [candidate division MSBL1 archaeon SCGC-AAA259O05]